MRTSNVSGRELYEIRIIRENLINDPHIRHLLNQKAYLVSIYSEPYVIINKNGEPIEFGSKIISALAQEKLREIDRQVDEITSKYEAEIRKFIN